MSDYSAAFTDFSRSPSEKQQNANLSIPEAAMDLGVSETRLRKTLAEGQFATEIEFRQTRTGVRKTAMLPPATIEALHKHYRALEQSGATVPPVPASAWLYPPADNPDTEPDDDYRTSRLVRESAEEAAYLEQKMKEKSRHLEEAVCPAEIPAPVTQTSASAPASGSVPLAQFNALLYQHNVLREDLARMNTYLADCDHLLEEMIKTIVTLEERMQSLERSRPPVRSGALSGALRSVSEGFQNAFARSKPQGSRSSLKPSEVYYANVLSR